MDNGHPAGTVTFLFTDIEGSTKLWEQYPQAMRVAQARHEALLRAPIEAHGGYVFKTVGDAFCAAFAIAADALAAILDAQRALAAEVWGETGPLRVRAALHTGAVESRGGDYFGHTLSRVARILSAGHGGQTLVSSSTAELVRGTLPLDLTLRDLGAHRLKSLTYPEQIFQLVAPDLPADFPQLKTLDACPTNLPAQLNALIGREQEVAACCELLRRPNVRLLTLTGPGGTGKTRMALQVAAELLDTEASARLLQQAGEAQRAGWSEGAGRFSDGVFFVALAPISEAGLVATTIAQALGLKETEGRPLVDRLKEYLREKQMLLVLDNFEQVADAAPLVGELLAAAPKLKVLVTSRIVLHLYGEHEFAVPPLGLPPRRLLPLSPARERPALRAVEGGPGGEGDLNQYESVRLFVDRARAVNANFTVTSENAQALVEICHRLDGLPLAIELAAARSKILSPQALLARLDNRLKLLTGGARDLAVRQQTIRGAIDWSYDLLDPGEQALFARLGVFVGGCTLEAVEAVCDAHGDLPIDVLDGLSALVDKSLLRQEQGIDDEPRFVMLETIREYALERLAERGEIAALRKQHADYYLVLAESAEPKLHGVDQGLWFDRLEAEIDNLRAVLEWARSPAGNLEVGLRLAGALWWFWFIRGYGSEGLKHLMSILSQLEGARLSEARAKALNGAAWLAFFYADLLLAQSCYQESLAISTPLEHKRNIAYTLRGLGKIAQRQRNEPEAISYLEQSLVLLDQLGDMWGRAWVLVDLGMLKGFYGDPGQAVACYEEALALYRKQGDKQGIAHALGRLGSLVDGQGDLVRARALTEESLAIYRELGIAGGVANSLNQLGELARVQGNYAEAARLYEESLALHRIEGQPGAIAMVLHNLAHTVLRQGNIERATALFLESLNLYRKLGDQNGTADCLTGLAGLTAIRGQPEQAVRLLGAVEELFEAAAERLDPADLAEYHHTFATARAQLDESTFAAAWAAGRALTLDQAVAEALALVKN